MPAAALTPAAAMPARGARESSSLRDALAAAEARAAALAQENSRLLTRLHIAEAAAVEARGASCRRDSDGTPLEADLEPRLAKVSEALWEGARRCQELAVERQQLVERCARAEVAAKSACDTAQNIAAKFGRALRGENDAGNEPNGVGHHGANGGGGPTNGGARTTPYRSAVSTPAAATPHADAPTPRAIVASRDELIQRGRSAFERHLRDAALRAATPGATPELTSRE